MESNAIIKHKTGIQWTHVPGYIGDTWNPTTGCTYESPGCKFCYADTLHTMRHRALQAGKKLPKQYKERFSVVQIWEERLRIPISRRKPHAFFVDSMSDLFHPDVPFEFIEKVYSTMMEANHHLYFILTKRIERAAEFYEWLRKRPVERRLWDKVKWPLPNVLLGASIENQEMADKRILILISIPVAYRFLSCEPLLGPLNLGLIGTIPETISPSYNLICSRLHMIIAGGESGKGAREMKHEWAASIMQQCKEADVPFFMKQMWKMQPIPEYLFVRQWPDFSNAHL